MTLNENPIKGLGALIKGNNHDVVSCALLLTSIKVNGVVAKVSNNLWYLFPMIYNMLRSMCPCLLFPALPNTPVTPGLPLV